MERPHDYVVWVQSIKETYAALTGTQPSEWVVDVTCSTTARRALLATESTLVHVYQLYTDHGLLNDTLSKLDELASESLGNTMSLTLQDNCVKHLMTVADVCTRNDKASDSKNEVTFTAPEVLWYFLFLLSSFNCLCL
ncbi:MAG: hypothetical protein EOM68_32110 [Spirochaetia bacterium]|nr:hypothetical protein [Spirochaetia bacterium]